jgi:hypothetical protein
MNRYKVFAAATFALLLAAACGSSGSSIGDVFGGGSGSNQAYTITGTVDSIDTGNHYIMLSNASGYSNLNPGNNLTRVYYDNRTSVNFQGRTYRPEDLERGDQVSITVNQSNNQLTAENVNVTYDVRGGMASSSNPYPNNGPYNGTYNSGSILTGTVRSVDTSRHTITVDPGYGGSYVTVDWNNNTPVYFNGRTYQAGDLEVGDQISVRVSTAGNTRVGAQDITVTRSISGNTSSNSSSGTYGTYTPSSNFSTIRGTVQYVDTVNHTITLSDTNWVQGFQRNTGSQFIIHFDPNARVDVSGQLYPLSNLERGDIIDVQMENNGSQNLAQRITLYRDINQR